MMRNETAAARHAGVANASPADGGAAERIEVAGPWITQTEVDYAADAAATAWGAGHSAYNTRFERAVADYVGVAHAVSLPHCTSAIHLALAALGIGPGDEVIVPDVTWIASVAPVVQVGAQPVFADIDPVTWCLDAASAEACVTARTRAIIGVDLYGSMVDWPALEKVAARHDLALVEDAAEALGSTLDGRAAGAHGAAGTFSFHGSKTVTTGEGGMLVTDDADLHARVLTLRDHGRPPGDRLFQNTEVGFKAKMSAVQAALGAAQMERIDAMIAAKREIFAHYAARLGARTDIALNAEPTGVRNSYWMVTVVPDPERGLDKFELMRRMDVRGIDTRPFFSRLSQLPAFADRPEAARFLSHTPAGTAAATGGINLPSGYGMTEARIDRVARALCEALDA